MTSILLDSLVASTSAFLLIYFPFAGAYLIFLKSYKSNIESKIFEIGQEIVELLYQKEEVLSPMSMVSKSYVDQAIEQIPEHNRDAAIHEAAKKISGQFIRDDGYCELLGKFTVAACYFSIVTERFEQLVPQGVSWTGKGMMYGPEDQEQSLKNKPFPFGTKRYREWIQKFGLIYSDIWLCVRSTYRHEYIKTLSEDYGITTEKHLKGWLEEIFDTVKKARSVHSRLIGQLHVLGTTTETNGFRKKIALICTYLVLVLATGYATPQLLAQAQTVTLFDIGLLSAITLILMVLATFRLVSNLNPSDELVELRRVYLPPLRRQMWRHKRGLTQLKAGPFENAQSMSNDLKLPKSFQILLQECINFITLHNRAGLQLESELAPLIERIRSKFHSDHDRTTSVGVTHASLSEPGYDYPKLRHTIASRDITLDISRSNEISSTDLVTVQLSGLSQEKRNELNDLIDRLRKTALASRAGADLWNYKNSLAENSRQLDAEVNELLRQRGPFLLRSVGEFSLSIHNKLKRFQVRNIFWAF